MINEIGRKRQFWCFQAWLSKTQTAIASEDMPQTLPEAEKLLQQHVTIKQEIDNYEVINFRERCFEIFFYWNISLV